MSIRINPNENPYHILYVDDEPSLLEIGKLYLERRWGFTVTTVQSAKEALQHLKLDPYDAIVSDFQMPEMDGIELLQEIRIQYQDLPFILLTGRGREEVVIKALNAGADFYLQKGGDPTVQFAELANQLVKAIQKKQAEYDRLHAEQALMEREEMFRTIFESSPVPITTISCINARIQTVNSSFLSMTGCTEDEVIGKTFGELGFFSDYQIHWFKEICQEKSCITDIPATLTGKRGDQIEVLITTTPITSTHSPFLLTTLVEITQQNQNVSEVIQHTDRIHSTDEQPTSAEEGITEDTVEMRMRDEGVLASEQKFKFLVDCCHEGILLTDLQGVILFANKATVRMVEFEDSSEVIGRNVLEFISEESREEVRLRYVQVGKNSEPLYSHHKIITRTGKEVFIESMGRIHTYNSTSALLITVRDVTDRLLSDEALKINDMRFQAVCENAGSWIWEIDSEGIYRYSNSVVEQILGYKPDELVGKVHFYNLLDPASRDDPRNDSIIAFSNFGPIKDHVYLFKHKNGNTVVLNISSTPAYDKRGRVSGYYGVSENITKRKATESDFQKLVGTLVRKTGLSAIRNISEILRSWLHADCVIFGKLNPDHSGVHAISMILDGKEISDGYYSLPGTPCEKTCEQEFHMCTDNVIKTFPGANILKQFQFRGYCGTPIRNYEGKPIGVLCVLSRKPLDPPEGIREVMDIIAGKAAAEIERSQIEDALRESEEKFRMLVDLSLDGIIIIDKNGILLFGNQAAGRIFDLDIQKLIESGSQNVLEFISPEFRDRVIYEISHVAEVIEPYTVDYQAVTSSGQKIWIEGIGKEITFHDSPAILLSLRDITTRKQMEDAILRKNKQLNLLSSITRHDILNMIMVIQGSLEIIQMDYSDPGLIEYVQKMRIAANTIKTQIEFSRFYQDMSSHTAQWFDLTSCIPLEHVPPEIHLKNNLNGIRVYADQMLGKIFFNLLDNSIRHGQVVTTIRVGSHVDNENLIIVWEDNGIGIPADLKEKIFELGFGKNTGFGLFLVREILSLTGITIHETGTYGTGARFELTFPKGMFQYI